MNKIVLLIVKRHVGEIDWILPVLHVAKRKNYKIVTIFNSYAAFKNLHENKELFFLWKKINYKFFVEKKIDNLINKILFKFFFNMKYNKISNFFLKKIYSLNFLEKKLTLNLKNIEFVFLAFNNFSYWPVALKSLNNCKIIRFPEAQHVWNYNSKYHNLKIPSPYKKLLADIVLLPTNSDLLKNCFSLDAKIIFCGVPKYEPCWIKNFKTKKISKKNKIKIIIITTRPVFKGLGAKHYFSEQSYNYIILSLVKTAKKIGNIKLIFKLHPNTEQASRIIEICKFQLFNNFSFSSEHIIKLAQKSDVCISMYSSAILDFLASKKPVIEFWLNKVDNIDLIRKHNSWVTIYSKLNLVHSVNNIQMLEKKIKYLLKNSSLSKTHLNNFRKIAYNKLNTLAIFNKIHNYKN